MDAADYVQIMRFVVGLDTAQPGSEWRRADCAPAETRGDGKLDIRDAVVAERYAGGVLPLTAESGPVDILASSATTLRLFNVLTVEKNEALDVSGVIRLLSDPVYGGEVLEVPVRLVSGGNVAGIGFSIRFDPSLLTLLGVSPSSQYGDVVSIANDDESAAGVFGYAARLPNGGTFAEGETTVMTLLFRAAEVTADTVTTISVSEDPTGIVLSDTAGEAVGVSTQGTPVMLLHMTAEGYPYAVTNLTAVALSDERVLLSWQGVSAVTSYEIHRRSETEVWALLAEIAADSQNYMDDGLTPGKRYLYRIVSLNETGRSGSEPVSVVTLGKFQSWIRTHLGAEGGEPDADKDGFSNYFEYLMGTDPLVPQKGLLRTGFEDLYGMEQHYFTLSFSVDPERSMESLAVDSTTNLTSSVWSTSTEISDVVSNGLRHLKFRSAVPKENAPSQFIRIRATLSSDAE